MIRAQLVRATEAISAIKVYRRAYRDWPLVILGVLIKKGLRHGAGRSKDLWG